MDRLISDAMSAARPEKREGPMAEHASAYRHVVLFKFKPTVPKGSV